MHNRAQVVCADWRGVCRLLLHTGAPIGRGGGASDFYSAQLARVRDGMVTSGVTLVYLDSAPENFVPELGLQVVSVLPDRWNGWLRPLATADAFGNFLDAWRRNDPNGIWGWASEVGDTLVCSRSDDDDPVDEFPKVDTLPDGQAVYDFTGWTWAEETSA